MAIYKQMMKVATRAEDGVFGELNENGLGGRGDERHTARDTHQGFRGHVRCSYKNL